MIFTSAPMIALVCAQIGHDWGFFIMVTDLPKYMSDVLHFSIKSNALYSSMPYMAMWIVSITTGILGDWLIKAGYLGITFSRKLFTTIGRDCYVFSRHRKQFLIFYFGLNSFGWSCNLYYACFVCRM